MDHFTKIAVLWVTLHKGTASSNSVALTGVIQRCGMDHFTEIAVSWVTLHDRTASCKPVILTSAIHRGVPWITTRENSF